MHLSQVKEHKLFIQKEEEKMNIPNQKLPNRRPCITTDVGEGVSITISYHPDTEEPVELFVTGRGRKRQTGYDRRFV